MISISQRNLAVVLVACLALLAGAAPAAADHTENTSQGIELVGFHPLHGRGFNTDVWPHVTDDDRLFAYVGHFGTGNECHSETDEPDGIKVVDVTDPANPEMVTSLPDPEGGKTNDVKVETGIETEHFTGDILVGSIEPCGVHITLSIVDGLEQAPREQTGYRLYDVTNPDEPTELGSYHNGGLGVHNLYVFQRPDLGRAFVANVHNEFPVVTGGVDLRGELQIVDISDPNDPELVGTWELADAEGQGGPPEDELCHRRGNIASCNLHDVWISDDGELAYLSFWDAGLILLDISDPEEPQFIGAAQNQLESSEDGTPHLEEQGNTHAAIPVEIDGRHIVVIGDEDFTGPGPQPHTVIDVAPDGAEVEEGEQFFGIELDATRPLSEGGVSGPAFAPDDQQFGQGSGCSYTQAQTAAGGEDWIAVARRGPPCPTFQEKVTAAERDGASGIVIANDVEGEGPVAGAGAGGIPGMMIGTEDGDRLIESLSFMDPVEVTLDLVPPADEDEISPWGFSRIIDITDSDPDNWFEVDRFKAPHVDTLDQGPEPEQSVFSAHNPILADDGRVYFSWYTNGLRVLEPDPDGEPGEFIEVGWFVPRPDDVADSPEGDPHGRFEDHAGFWGSLPVTHPRTGDLLILNADINRGLYILRSTLDDGEPTGACPADVPPSGFGDVAGNVHEDAIDCVAWYDITVGTGTVDADGQPRYGPAEATTRAQMASFIARTALVAGVELPDDPPDAFRDDDGSVHEDNINALAELGVIAGRTGTTYDPHAEVTRGQMASLIARLYELVIGELPEPSRDHFPDDDGSVHEDNINALAELGVVEGRDVAGERRYLPAQSVRRDQMASFLARSLDLFAEAGLTPPA